jgi:hypothetical protein
MVRLRSAVIAAVVGWLAIPASAATYYVDAVAGDDAADGSDGAPWRTVQHAAATLQPGDTVVVRPGVYVEAVNVATSGTPEAPITYRAEPGAVLESPNPSLSLSAFGFQPGVGHVIVEGVEARGGYHETIFLRTGTHDIAIRDCNVHDNRVGLWVSSATNVEIDGCRIHDNTTLGLRVSGTSRFVTVRDTESYANDDGWGCFGDADGFVVDETAADVTFADSIARDNAEDGFDLQGDRMLVQRSVSRDNGCGGIKLSQNARVENVLVRGGNLGIRTGSQFNAPIVVEIFNATVADNVGQQLYFKQPSGNPPMPYQVILRNVIAVGPGKAIEAASAVQLVEDHNVFFRDETTSHLIVRYLPDGGERRYTGQEVNAGVWTAETGQGAGTFAMPPDFVDAVDYRVAADSVAVDGGNATGAPADALDGAVRPQGNGTDLGAYEAQTGLANHRPWADPGPPRTKLVGARVDFTAFGSVDPDGDPLTYWWDFGDGSEPVAGDTAAHVYVAEGQYSASLTVSDGVRSHTRTALVTVVGSVTPAPTPSATPSPEPTVVPGSGCGLAPRPNCRTATYGKLIVRPDLSGGSDHHLVWKWSRGVSTPLADLGDPVLGSTAYAFCAYDHAGGTPTLVASGLVPPGGTCGLAPCWRRLLRGTIVYRDPAMEADGVYVVRVRPSLTGRAKVVVKMTGANFAVPTLPLAQAPSVTVQLANDDGECWGSDFATPAIENHASEFRSYIMP